MPGYGMFAGVFDWEEKNNLKKKKNFLLSLF